MVMHPDEHIFAELGCAETQLATANCAPACEGAHSAEYNHMLRGTQVRILFVLCSFRGSRYLADARCFFFVLLLCDSPILLGSVDNGKNGNLSISFK